MGEGATRTHPELGRRSLLAGGLALLAAPAWAGMPESRRIAFHVVRNGRRIGTHVLTFAPSGNRLDVEIAVDIEVKMMALVLYRYTLRGRERWEDGVLVEATSDTQDGNDKAFLRASRRDGALQVEGSHGKPYTAPPGSLVGSHWNPAQMNAPMINLQDGELLDFKVASRGTEGIEVRGQRIEATHYGLTGPGTLDLWYDQGQVWTQLRSVVRDGSTVEYHPV